VNDTKHKTPAFSLQPFPGTVPGWSLITQECA
jgi:hypothetical protein